MPEVGKVIVGLLASCEGCRAVRVHGNGDVRACDDDAVHVRKLLHPCALGTGRIVQILQVLLGVEVEEVRHVADRTVVVQGDEPIWRGLGELVPGN